MPRRSRKAQPKRAPEPQLSYWIVAFLDLLGYRSQLARIDVFPIPDDPPARDSLLAEFARAVRLRRRLIGYIEDFLSQRDTAPPPPEWSRLPKAARRLAGSWRQVQILRAPGADHMVFGCSLAPADDHFPMRGVYTTAASAAVAALFQLAMGADDVDDTLPLRGGIDIAVGGLLQPEGFLYSPALTRAYELENDRARYARVVAGERVLQFIGSALANPDTDPTSEMNRMLANRVDALFFKDKDGSVSLDFLSDEIRGHMDAESARDWAAKAWTFVRAADRRARARGDYDVAAKYAWLVDHMKTRLRSWGVAP